MQEYVQEDPPPRGFLSGSEVGGYRIGSRLGAGAMGAVYSAYDGGGSLVAVKFLHAHLDSDARGRERLRREASALQRLRHPGIAQILDVEFDGPEAFIVTELVDGPTLEDEIAGRGPLDAWDLYELAEQLCAALEAVHIAGVVHRDLKPSNVLVASRGPVLIDFGIAHGLDDPRVTATGLVMGTPGYLPPELLDGARPNSDTDWWGWAALLSYAATGRAPFGVRPTEAVLARSRSGTPDLGGLGPTTAAALGGALRADPDRRWGPGKVVAALRRAADEGDAPSPTIVIGPPTSPTEVVAPVTVIAPSIPATQQAVHDGQTRVVPAEHAPSGPPPPTFAPGSQVAGLRDPSTAPEPATAQQAVPASAQAPGAAPAAEPGADPFPRPAYVRPTPRGRTGVLLALAVPAVLLACLFPVIAVLVYAALALGARIVGVAADTFHTRRERRGVTGRDALRAAATLPWHVVRAVLGSIPSILVGVCAGVVIVVGGWWILGQSGLGTPRNWIEPVILALAGAAVLAMAWTGPATYLTKYGARSALNVLAPGKGGAAILIVVAVVVAAILVWLVATGSPIVWSPLVGPPPY